MCAQLRGNIGHRVINYSQDDDFVKVEDEDENVPDEDYNVDDYIDAAVDEDGVSAADTGAVS